MSSSTSKTSEVLFTSLYKNAEIPSPTKIDAIIKSDFLFTSFFLMILILNNLVQPSNEPDYIIKKNNLQVLW